MKVQIPALPGLPERISRLSELAFNLWWSWHADARSLFRNLDRTLWNNTNHNPVQMLQKIDGERLLKAAENQDFLHLYDSVLQQLDSYLSSEDTWFSRNHWPNKPKQIAYLCAEFAIHSSLPIYSGGLGLLAGDTCKEASDLGLPLMGVGCLYPEGYFRQRIEADGTQNAIYERLDVTTTPLLPVLNDDDTRLLVPVNIGDREVQVGVWKVQVGRIPIYLMDTNLPENEPWDRDLVARLYSGDNPLRLRQEVILGMGGVRVIRALGYDPEVFHLNEGHAAFAALELIKEYLWKSFSLDEAVDQVRRRLVFTTHTPVKAGHDEFPFHLMEEHFSSYWEEHGISREEFLQLGTPIGGNSFSMTVLALKTCSRANGVSRKHGEVSRMMWHFLYPAEPVDAVPIVSITNGVHVPTWLAPEFWSLFSRYLGPGWFEKHDSEEAWREVQEIPNDLLWNTHQALKNKLFSFVRERARARWIEDGVSPGQIIALGALLDPQALTIGFARRFATYKRADLILRDLERLTEILHNPWRPVQIIFAGKPHPADEPGRFLLKRVFEVCSNSEMGGHIAFIENYDKHVAHFLVRGVDVWLNNPVPPKEASGTSGQKASLNGVINLSVLDGWWYEGYTGKNGWTVEGATDDEAADSIYSTLEKEIIPLFYQRDAQGIPQGWVQVMKEAVCSNAPRYSARRMLKEYVENLYLRVSEASTLKAVQK